jgi:hypothetical protein
MPQSINVTITIGVKTNWFWLVLCVVFKAASDWCGERAIKIDNRPAKLVIK